VRRIATLFRHPVLAPAMGLIKGIFTVVGVLLLALVGIAAYLWFTDYEAQATITDKGQDENGPYVVITPKLFARDVTMPVTSEQASFICIGYKVAYRIQTGHYQVFDDRDELVYDSNEGLVNTGSAIRCGVANQGGGIIG
jgi:hypothetical protein